MSEPVIKAVRKARAQFKATPAGQLMALCAERSRWSRKLTIAQNKLDSANRAIESFARDLAFALAGKGPHE